MHIVDVAGYLARVVDEPRALGRRIDIGMDGALTFEDLGKLSSHLLDTPIKVRTIPWAPVNVAMKNGGVFSPGLRDFRPMLAYFSTGQSVADTALQEQLFGPVPTVEQTLRRYLREAGLTAS